MRLNHAGILSDTSVGPERISSLTVGQSSILVRQFIMMLLAILDMCTWVPNGIMLEGTGLQLNAYLSGCTACPETDVNYFMVWLHKYWNSDLGHLSWLLETIWSLTLPPSSTLERQFSMVLLLLPEWDESATGHNSNSSVLECILIWICLRHWQCEQILGLLARYCTLEMLFRMCSFFYCTWHRAF